MNWDRTMRLALWASVPANFAVAVLFLAPESALGQLAGLPQPAPHPAYGAMLAMMVALFGAAYGWLAGQPAIGRPFIVLATVGKSCAFGITFVLWLMDLASDRRLCLMMGDLIFAAIFTGWLLSTRAAARGSAPGSLHETHETHEAAYPPGTERRL